MVTLRQLRYLDTLARTRHFGRAAGLCAVTQPALSMQVKELEREVGLDLVERSGGGVRLTADGLELARRAEAILAGVQDLLSYARQRQGALVGPFRLGIIPSVAPYLLPDLLRLAGERHPALELRVRETQTAPLVAELLRGDLDGILLALPAGDERVEARALFDDPFHIAVAAESAPSWRAEADKRARLQAAPLLLLEEGHCLRDQTLLYCRLADGPQRMALGATSLTTILHMVAGGHGVTLLPELCARREIDGGRVALIPFPYEPPKRVIGLGWRRGSSRTEDLRLLGDLIREAALPDRNDPPALTRPVRQAQSIRE